ncbi:MAG: hypothetical protein O6765_01580 [Gammaproteobacteria bacterium]|nr:hypothetical protein [Gammaproteobacteria bacterium]
MSRQVISRRRRVLSFIVGLTLLGSAGYVVFELGRYQGGYSVVDQRREREDLQQLISQQVAFADELRRQIASLQTSGEIDQETYAQVESNLSQLQLRIQAQEEQLVFYQGIISPENGLAGLRIQALNLTKAESEGHYVLRLVLVQAITHDRRVSGVVKFNIEGVRDGEVLELGPDDVLLDSESADIPYGFRYFQGLQRDLVLPADFRPSQVNVEIWPQGSRGQPISQSYQWSAVTG